MDYIYPLTFDDYADNFLHTLMESAIGIPAEDLDIDTIGFYPVFSLYTIHNNKNGKVYYGVHKEDGRPYYGSGDAIKASVKLHGKEHFTRFIMWIFNKQEEAYALERFIVDIGAVKDPMCYNLRAGGIGSGSGELNHNYGKTGELSPLFGIAPTKSCQEARVEATCKECMIGDITFKSQKEAADYFGISTPTMSYCVKNIPENERLDYIGRLLSPNFVIEGMTFDTVEEGAKYFGVSNVTFWKWATTPNKKLKDCVIKEQKTFTINGITFNTHKEAAEYFNVASSTIYRWSTTPGIKRNIQKTKKYSIHGITFNTHKEAAEYFNVSSFTIRYWIKHPNKPDCFYISSEPIKYPLTHIQ